MCWCPARCGAPLRDPRRVVCPPVVGACPVCCPPLRWALAPCAGAPPRCCGPDRDHCHDRLEATAPHRIHSLAPWRHQGSGYPHAYGSCVRRAGSVHAVIHSPQQAFSQQSSGAAASRSRSHSSATDRPCGPWTCLVVRTRADFQFNSVPPRLRRSVLSTDPPRLRFCAGSGHFGGIFGIKHKASPRYLI